MSLLRYKKLNRKNVKHILRRKKNTYATFFRFTTLAKKPLSAPSIATHDSNEPNIFWSEFSTPHIILKNWPITLKMQSYGRENISLLNENTKIFFKASLWDKVSKKVIKTCFSFNFPYFLEMYWTILSWETNFCFNILGNFKFKKKKKIKFFLDCLYAQDVLARSFGRSKCASSE